MPGPFYFAWAGGTIADQVTIVTTGNTHGGILQTLQIVAGVDIQLGNPNRQPQGCETIIDPQQQRWRLNVLPEVRLHSHAVDGGAQLFEMPHPIVKSGVSLIARRRRRHAGFVEV